MPFLLVFQAQAHDKKNEINFQNLLGKLLHTASYKIIDKGKQNF